jgi:hypothetical protein
MVEGPFAVPVSFPRTLASVQLVVERLMIARDGDKGSELVERILPTIAGSNLGENHANVMPTI